MKLLVYWGLDNEADLQVPKDVKWDDGTAASLDDYNKHRLDTQTTRNTEKGMVTIISPELVAVTRFETEKGCWVIVPPGGVPFDLQEKDPNASEDTLMLEISSYPVAFKTTFDRTHSSETISVN